MDSLVDQKFNICLVQTIQKYPIIYDTNLKGYKETNWLYRKNKAWEDIAKKLNTEQSVLKKKWKWFRLALRKKLKTMQKGKYVRPYYLYEHLKFLIPYMQNVKEPVTFMNRIKYEETDEEDDKDDENSQYETGPGQHVDQNEKTDGIYENEYDPLNFDYDEDDFDSTNTSESLPAKKQKLKSVRHDFHVSKTTDVQARRSNTVQNSAITYSPSGVASTSTGNAKCGEVAASRNAKIQFLYSILPDLNEMSNSQMRHFKSRVLQLVDKILRENLN